MMSLYIRTTQVLSFYRMACSSLQKTLAPYIFEWASQLFTPSQKKEWSIVYLKGFILFLFHVAMISVNFN